MPKIHGWIFLFSSALCLVLACQKGSPTDVQNPEDQKDNSGSMIVNNPGLSYGDTLFYLKSQPGSYTVLPVSKPAAPGTFKSIPMGLVLDSVTGLINVTQSEAGLRYKIYYVGANATALDSVKLVISGIDYKDAIYEIASTPNSYDTAFPIYNARPEFSTSLR